MPYSPRFELYNKKQTSTAEINFDTLEPLQFDILNPYEEGAITFSNLYDYKISLLLTSGGKEPIEKVEKFLISLIRSQHTKGTKISDIRRIIYPYIVLCNEYSHTHLTDKVMKEIKALLCEPDVDTQARLLSRQESIIIKGSFSLSPEEVKLVRKTRK